MQTIWVKERITFRHWALAHTFLALSLGWGLSIIFFPSSSYVDVVNPMLVLLMGSFIVLGGILATVGMLMTRAYRQLVQHVGLWIELLGTILIAGGILQYFSIQVGYLVAGEFDLRYNLVWLAYVLGSFVLLRFTFIVPGLLNANRVAKLNNEEVL